MMVYSPNWPRLKIPPLYPRNAAPKSTVLRFEGPGVTAFLILAEPSDDHVIVRTILYDVTRDKTIERRETPVKVSWSPVGSRGGKRPYFHCLTCQRKCTVVFFDIGDPDPVCRTCAGITYTSQNKNRYERTEERLAALRRRIGSSRNFHPIPRRPKGMHRKTYDRLVAEIWRLEGELVGLLDRPQQLRAHTARTFAQMREDAERDPDEDMADIRLEFINLWEGQQRQDDGADYDPDREYLSGG